MTVGGSGQRQSSTREAGPSITRERILDVAEAHLIQSGYRGLSLAKVAREVGLAKPSLYYHFPEGKEELVVALLQRSLQRLGEGLEQATRATDDSAGRLRAIARWLMTEPERGHPVGKLHDVARFVAERHYRALAEGLHETHYWPVRAVISAAIESGEFRKGDPDFLTWAFLSLIGGLIEVASLPSAAVAPVADSGGRVTADELVDLFLRGVLA